MHSGVTQGNPHPAVVLITPSATDRRVPRRPVAVPSANGRTCFHPVRFCSPTLSPRCRLLPCALATPHLCSSASIRLSQFRNRGRTSAGEEATAFALWALDCRRAAVLAWPLATKLLFALKMHLRRERLEARAESAEAGVRLLSAPSFRHTRQNRSRRPRFCISSAVQPSRRHVPQVL